MRPQGIRRGGLRGEVEPVNGEFITRINRPCRFSRIAAPVKGALPSICHGRITGRVSFMNPRLISPPTEIQRAVPFRGGWSKIATIVFSNRAKYFLQRAASFRFF